MAIDFPNSPSTGDLHTVNGKQWQWDAEKWIAYGISLAPDVLKVDSGNNRVGINQTAPAYSLDVTGTARITGDLTVQGTTTTIESAAVNTSLVFEGATADAYETTLTLVDPTADRTITLPDTTGTVALTTDLSSYATLASPTLTGTPVAPTAAADTNTTQLATTAFVMTELGDYLTTATASSTYLTTATASSTYSPLASPTLTGTATMDVGIQKAVSIAAENGHVTLALTHAGKLISLGGAASQNITVPPNSSVAFPTGTQIAFFDEQTGGGINTFVEGSGVTIRSKDSNKVMDGNWTTVVIIKQSTDVWYLFGPLTS